jgi:hypothetical protein
MAKLRALKELPVYIGKQHHSLVLRIDTDWILVPFGQGPGRNMRIIPNFVIPNGRFSCQSS